MKARRRLQCLGSTWPRTMYLALSLTPISHLLKALVWYQTPRWQTDRFCCQNELLSATTPYQNQTLSWGSKDFESVSNALIKSRLDYCNSVCWPEGSHLSIGQNSAARHLTGRRKMDHITPVLASLHWLRFHFFCFNDVKLPSPTVCMQPLKHSNCCSTCCF